MALTIDLAGSVVLVTGGTRGVGAGIARRFTDAGADVVVCGRTAPDEDGGPEFISADVRDPDDVVRLVDDIVDRHGRLDVLVNNAGGSPPAEAATHSPGFTSAIVDLNLVAAFTCAQRANAVMQGQSSGGAIVNIASLSGVRPSPGTAAYGAAKAGLINLTTTLAMEWAPKVRVNCVAPGLIATEQAAHYERPAVPLERLGQPTDVGDACVFLASPMASYVAGATLVVHGGGEWLASVPQEDAS